MKCICYSKMDLRFTAMVSTREEEKLYRLLVYDGFHYWYLWWYINWGFGLGVIGLNSTFNNISVISWRSVLLVEETGVLGESHWPVASYWQTLSHNVVSYMNWILFILEVNLLVDNNYTISEIEAILLSKSTEKDFKWDLNYIWISRFLLCKRLLLWYYSLILNIRGVRKPRLFEGS